MTVMIGIHQKQDKVDKLYENMGLHAAPLTAVGPFASKAEALEWQTGMQEKIPGCQVIDPAGTEDNETPWYGFSFEK